MLTNLLLLGAVGGGLRLAMGWGLRRRYDLRLTIPQPIVVVVLILSGLPDWLQPIPFPFPFSFMLGAVLPDLIIRRI